MIVATSNTYDGHHGTDIAIWPYSFYKMDNNQIEVIAAAAGTITQKMMVTSTVIVTQTH